QSGVSCPAPELVEEAWGQDALNRSQYAEAELHFGRALAAIVAERVPPGNDALRINTAFRMEADWWFMSRAALGLGSLDRARSDLDKARDLLAQLSSDATTRSDVAAQMRKCQEMIDGLARAIDGATVQAKQDEPAQRGEP